MFKVTSVEPQKKNPRRFNVFLDGVFVFGADEDTVVNFRLVVGKEIDQETLNKVLFETEVGKLMERMYRLFGIRARSEKEVRDYLRNLSFKRKVKEKDEISEVVINSLIEKLTQKGLLNDQEFAKAWVEARRKSKKKGNIALKGELYQKGVSREIIEQMDNGQWTMDNEKQLAQEALQKKLKSWKNLPVLEFKKKAYEFLMRRGFEYDVVREVVEKKLKKD